MIWRTVTAAAAALALTTTTATGPAAASPPAPTGHAPSAATAAYPTWPATRYRSLTRPDICLAANQVSGTVTALTALCDGGRAQLWHYTHGSTNLMLINDAWTMCLEWAYSYVFMNYCADATPTQRWNAKAVNGHLYFQAYGTDDDGSTGRCLIRTATTNEVVVTSCPPMNNVPNAFAWDYFV